MTLIPSKIQPNEALEQFLQLCHKKNYPPKATIIHPGDIGDRLFYIIEGSVSVGVEDDDGRELILAYLNKHDFIGEIGVFKSTVPRKVSVKTRTKCTLAEIAYDRMKQALKKELAAYAAEILYLLGDQLATRLLTTSRKFCDLAFMDVEGRIARALLDLCKEPDAMTHPEGMQISITRQEIGRLVGCSREMAGRVLKEMEDKGLITAHGKTIVVFCER